MGSDKKDLEFKSIDDLKTTLENMPILADIPEEIYEELAQYLLPGKHRCILYLLEVLGFDSRYQFLTSVSV